MKRPARTTRLRELPGRLPIMLAVAAILVASCDLFAEKHHKKREKKERAAEAAARAPVAPRDWTRFPAVVERNTSEDIVGLGDVHGGHDRLVKLLSAGGLIKAAPGSRAGYAWAGGRKTLVSVGDLIDKGDQGIAVIELMMALEAEASAAGGAVIVTLGNHEAEFLSDPLNKKAKREFVPELKARGLDPASVANGEGEYGQWIRNRPLAAKVNGWFFAHGGNTAGLSIPALEQRFRAAVDANDWGAPFLVGDTSILEAQKWWKQRGVDADLAALHARHIVFGHDPGAFDRPGQIATGMAGQLFRIDVGMSPAIDYSAGALLIIHRAGGTDDASSLDPSGHRTPIWHGPE